MGLNIVVLGAGGIGQATALMLAEWAEDVGRVILVDVDEAAARNACNWVERSRSNAMRSTSLTTAPHTLLRESLSHADLILDATPGACASENAVIAVEHRVFYANLTEHVKETEAITRVAGAAKRGVLLQAGLAPGYINILALELVRRFTERYGVTRVEDVLMRVGALTQHAAAPHYYGFTWSPVGVATEYVEPAVAVRGGVPVVLPSLSERELRVIDGRVYEEALTSGGAADVPNRLLGRASTVDYKTLRYPGHYDWVRTVVAGLPPGEDTAVFLEREMLRCVPHVEDDVVIVYAAVQGVDQQGRKRRLEHAARVEPVRIGNVTLRAIQATTAAGLVEAALQMVRRGLVGVVLQGDIDGRAFLGGPIVQRVYGGCIENGA